MRTCARSLRRPVAAAALVRSSLAAARRINNSAAFSNATTSSSSKQNSLKTMATSSASSSVAADYEKLTAKLKELSALQVSEKFSEENTRKTRRELLHRSTSTSTKACPPPTSFLPSKQGIQGLLGWDEMVMLPPGQGASEARAQQKAALAGFVHEASTSPALGELLAGLERAAKGASSPSDAASTPAPLDEWALANVREASRDFARASAIPKELAKKKAALESSAYAAWLEARTKSDFSIFAPALKEWIELCQEIAKKIAPDAPTYDTLLNEFEVGATEERILEIFDCVKAGVVPLRKEIIERGKKIPSSPSFGGGGKTEFDPKIQAKLCEEIALDLGFDLEKGRLDVSSFFSFFFWPGERERRREKKNSPFRFSFSFLS